MMVKLLPLLYKMSGHAIYLIAGLGVVLGVDFQNKITLGSVLVATILVIIAGVFTIRSKIATIWREEAEGERAAKERLQEELAEARADHAAFEREQQEVRHALKDELVGARAQVQVLEAKTDLTTAVASITASGEQGSRSVAQQLTDMLRTQADRSAERDRETHALLMEIRDKLPTSPVHVHATEPLPVHEVERRKS